MFDRLINRVKGDIALLLISDQHPTALKPIEFNFSPVSGGQHDHRLLLFLPLSGGNKEGLVTYGIYTRALCAVYEWNFNTWINGGNAAGATASA